MPTLWFRNIWTWWPDAAKPSLKQITGKSLSSTVIAQSFSNLDITYDPLTSAVQTAAEHAYALGFLKSNPDLNGLYYLGPLNQVLTSKGLAAVAGS